MSKRNRIALTLICTILMCAISVFFAKYRVKNGYAEPFPLSWIKVYYPPAENNVPAKYFLSKIKFSPPNFAFPGSGGFSVFIFSGLVWWGLGQMGKLKNRNKDIP